MKYDVLIVGAGVTGALLFLALKNKNINVGLIDGRDKAPNSYRHLSLNNKSMAFLKKLDAWNDISKTAFEYNQIKVWDQEGTGFIDFNVNELEKNIPNIGFIVKEGEIQNSLLSLVSDSKDLLWSCNLEKIEKIDEDIHCETSKGKLETKILIGADGIQSSVRNLSSITSRTWSYNQTAIVANFSVLQTDPCIRQTFTSVGPLALLPMNETELTMIWSIDDTNVYDYLSMSEDDFINKIHQSFGEKLPEIKFSAKRQSFPLKHLSAKTFARGNVFLVGDAAHHIHPLAGLGLNAGIGDVKSLSDLITPESLLQVKQIEDKYNRQRIPINLALAAAMEAFKRGFEQKNIWIRLIRNHAFSLTNKLTFLKNKFIELATEL
jgi:2-octaprenylphenol hydroxylase